MSIIVGFTKITYFAKPANLARIEIMTQQNRHIVSWRFSQKMGNLGKGGIEQKSIHDLAKPQIRWQKGNIDKRQISTNIASVPKIPQGFGQILK